MIGAKKLQMLRVPMIHLDWHGLYREGWKGQIVPDAFSHPAKYSRGLIREIYAFLLREGMLCDGNTVLDPFGGVALGGLDAMLSGCHWFGVELEQKFVDLGEANIALWNKKYADKMPKWGSAQIIRGDSRWLLEVIQSADCAIASPPFAEAQSGGGIAVNGYHNEKQRKG